jgi:hypothetical protein
MDGHPGDVDLAGTDLDEEQRVDPLEQHLVNGRKSQTSVVCACAERNCFHVGPARLGAGPMENLPHHAGRYPVALWGANARPSP